MGSTSVDDLQHLIRLVMMLFFTCIVIIGLYLYIRHVRERDLRRTVQLLGLVGAAVGCLAGTIIAFLNVLLDRGIIPTSSGDGVQNWTSIIMFGMLAVVTPIIGAMIVLAVREHGMERRPMHTPDSAT